MSEFKERMNEVMEDLRGRIRNPLILSFILVWFYFHWKLIYQIFTIDNSIAVSERLKVLTDYIKNNDSWCGMVGIPLFWSIVSLISYYLIAIFAQGLKVVFAKRLNAWVLAKVDRGSFALKTEVKEEKANNKRISNELEEAKATIRTYVSEKSSMSGQIKEMEIKLTSAHSALEEIRGNIMNNKNFLENYGYALLYFLSKGQNIGASFHKSEILRNHPEIMNGNWRGHYSDIYTPRMDSGSPIFMSIDENTIYDREQNIVGKIEQFKYDRGITYVEFVVKKNSNDEGDVFRLIMLNKNEFMGFRNKSFAHLARQI